MIDIEERLKSFIDKYGYPHDKAWIDLLSEVMYRRFENEMLKDAVDTLTKDKAELFKHIDTIYGKLWGVLDTRGSVSESTEDQDAVDMIIALLKKTENENNVMRDKVRALQYEQLKWN